MDVNVDAPSRKKRPRAARITFPDPDRGRKPKPIPTLRFKTEEEWKNCRYVHRLSPLWAIQRSYTNGRELEEIREAERLERNAQRMRRDAYVAAVAVRLAARAAVAAAAPEAAPSV